MSERLQLAAKLAAPLVLGSVALLGAMHQWEDQRLTVYADKLAGGLPTYCSGRTQPPRPVGEVLTQAQCNTIDRKTAIEYGRAVLACVPADKFDQNSLDAFTLFAINVGKHGACTSRAAGLMRDGNREAACKALARTPDGRPAWSYASGVYVQGLQNRRQYERNWCLRLAEAG
jgi:lysozyme